MAKSGKTKAARAASPLFPPTAPAGSTVPVYGATSTPGAGSTGVLGSTPTPASGATTGLPPGYYVGSKGELRRPDGSRAVGKVSQNARNDIAGIDSKTWLIVGGVAVVVVGLIWWAKSRKQASILDRVKAAASKGVAGVRSAAGV